MDRFVRWLLLASSPWIGLIAFGNDALFNLVLGDQWQGAGYLAAVLVFPAALFTITNWMDRLLDAVGRQDVESQGRGSRGSHFGWYPLDSARGGRLTLPSSPLAKRSSAPQLSCVYLDLLRDRGLVPFSIRPIVMRGDCCWSFDLRFSGPSRAGSASDCCVYRGRSNRFVHHDCHFVDGPERIAMITIVNYGVGNLGALVNMFEFIGYDVRIADESSLYTRCQSSSAARGGSLRRSDEPSAELPAHSVVGASGIGAQGPAVRGLSRHAVARPPK